MAEDPGKNGGGPNLELPSLFGRGRKKKQQQLEAEAELPATVEAPVSEAPASEASARPGPAPVEGSTRRPPPTPPPAGASTAQDTAPVRATAPPAEPEVEPEPVPVAEPEPTPVAEPEPVPVAVEQTSVLPGPARTAEPADEEPGRRRAARERRPITLPRINPRFAAAVTGLVVGLVGVLLSYGASQGCEAVRGVGSCGGTGLFALLAVVAIQVLLGSLLLKAFGLNDPTSTSFLGVGLVAVLALLFFLGSLESIWMLLVIPVLTAITFLVSWWVTETFIEAGADDNLHR